MNEKNRAIQLKAYTNYLVSNNRIAPDDAEIVNVLFSKMLFPEEHHDEKAIEYINKNDEFFRNMLKNFAHDNSSTAFSLIGLVLDNYHPKNTEDKINLVNVAINLGDDPHKPYEEGYRLPLNEILKMVPAYHPTNAPLINPKLKELIINIIKTGEAKTDTDVDYNNQIDRQGHNAMHVITSMIAKNSNMPEYFKHDMLPERKTYQYIADLDEILQNLKSAKVYSNIPFNQNNPFTPNDVIENFRQKFTKLYTAGRSSLKVNPDEQALGISESAQVHLYVDKKRVAERAGEYTTMLGTHPEINNSKKLRDLANLIFKDVERKLSSNYIDEDTLEGISGSFKSYRNKYFKFFSTAATLHADIVVNGSESLQKNSLKMLTKLYCQMAELFSDEQIQRANIITKSTGSRPRGISINEKNEEYIYHELNHPDFRVKLHEDHNNDVVNAIHVLNGSINMLRKEFNGVHMLNKFISSDQKNERGEIISAKTANYLFKQQLNPPQIEGCAAQTDFSEITSGIKEKVNNVKFALKEFEQAMRNGDIDIVEAQNIMHENRMRVKVLDKLMQLELIKQNDLSR